MTIVILINCIGFSVRDASGKIGIMRALGVRKTDTFKMFFWETCMVITSATVIATIIIELFVLGINKYFRGLHMEKPFDILNIHYSWMVAIYVVTFLLGIFILKIPLHRYSNKKPTELLNRASE